MLKWTQQSRKLIYSSYIVTLNFLTYKFNCIYLRGTVQCFEMCVYCERLNQAR
jgi:wyosine [tRNA(Phe)-imidazoG37] synthetase (radical SAM superfamily)